jgi:hypothetical protein
MSATYPSNVQEMKPIFVVGYMHSGTTLMQKILGLNSSVYAGKAESRFFAHYNLIAEKFPNLQDDVCLHNYIDYLIKIIELGYGTTNYFGGNQQEQMAVQDLHSDGSLIAQIVNEAQKIRKHKEIFVIVYNFLAIAANKTAWIEKTPRHIFHVEPILATLPMARFIEVVRDPRDILASKFRRQSDEWLNQRDQAKRELVKLIGGYDPIWDSIGWMTAIRAGNLAAQKFPNQILRIRYEDLVEDPKTKVKTICDFLGLEYADAMLDVAWVNATTVQAGVKKGINNSAKGKWKKTLKPEAVALCQSITKSEMRLLTYAPEAVPFAARAKALLVISYSGYEFFERLYKRWRLGGTKLLRSVLSDYWARSTSFTKLTPKS